MKAESSSGSNNNQFVLPFAWKMRYLTDCAEILDSMRIPINNDERSLRIVGKSEKELYPYYGATGQVGLIDSYLFAEELLLLGEDGVPFFDPLKTKAYIVNGKYWVNNHAHVLRPRSKIAECRFLCHYLNQFDYRNFVAGSTRTKLTQADMKQIPIPLPPLPEQERIAARLDLLLGKLKAARKRLDAMPELIKRFRKSVLAEAVSGRLTEEWREEHAAELPSAEELLDQVRKERRAAWEKAELEKMRAKGKAAKDESWKARYVEPEVVDASELTEVPKGWASVRLEYVCLRIQDGNYGEQYPSESDFMPTGIPFFTSASILSDGSLDLVTCKRISPQKHRELTKAQIHPEDVIFPNRGAKDGQLDGTFKFCAYVPDSIVTGNINPQLTLLRPIRELVLPRFLFHLLGSETCMRQIRQLSGGSAMRFINLTQTKGILFRICSLPEQSEIVRRVDELFAYADALETRVAVARTLAERLEPSILAKAFRGELSEQLPEEAVEWERKLAEIEAAAGELGALTPPRDRGRKPKAGAGTDAPAKAKRPRGRPRKAP